MIPPCRGITPPAQPGPGTPSDKRERVVGRDVDDLDHLLRAAGEHDAVGPSLVNAAVVFIQQQVRVPMQDRAFADNANQVPERGFGQHKLMVGEPLHCGSLRCLLLHRRRSEAQ